jgi:hypothetical protein
MLQMGAACLLKIRTHIASLAEVLGEAGIYVRFGMP